MSLAKDIRFYADTLRALPALRQARLGNYRKLQDRRLREIVRHAYDNVELYRRKYQQAGVHPSDIQTADDLAKLPIITRQDLADGFPEAILARDYKPEDRRLVATSGSTGMPLKIYRDRTSLRRAALGLMMTHRLVKRETGIEVKAGLLAISVETPDSLEAVMVEEIFKLPHFLTKAYHAVSATENTDVHLRALAEHRPDTLLTYPSVLRNLAIVARDKGLTVHQPKVLAVTAELLDEHTKRLVTSVFKGEIVNTYASTEGGTMAMECGQHQGLHVAATSAILELVEDGRPVAPGVPGNVVLTNLINRSTPIIRYSGMGDVAVFRNEQCPCGNRQPLLKVIEGRIVDSLVLSDGRLIHPFTLTLALEHVPMIARFQIVQECFESVRAMIVPEKESDGHRDICERTRQNLTEILGESVQIRVDLVEDIPESRQPGFHTVKSLVAKQGRE
jgi:phenylacetate-CoA ligase